MFQKIGALVFFQVVFYFCASAQNTDLPYSIGEEKLESFIDSNGIPRTKSAWLPNGQQTLTNGNGYREYMIANQIRRYYLRDGVSNGLYYFTDLSRTRITQLGYFKGDLKDGEWMWFDENGKVVMTIEFDSNVVVSPLRYFYPNGNLQIECEANTNLEKSGKFIEYYENGQVKLKGDYSLLTCISSDSSIRPDDLSSKFYVTPKSVQTGSWQEYYMDGSIKREFQFDSICNLIVLKTQLDNGMTSTSVRASECPIGKWIDYDEEGNVLSVKIYRDCLLKEETNE